MALGSGAVRLATSDGDGIASVSVGRPIPHTPCVVVDESGDPTPAGRVGRILIGCSCLAEGVARVHARGASWVDTGDIGFLDADHELHILGRSTDILNCAGVKYYPDEIEAIATELGVCRAGRAVAIGATDASLGTERLVLAFEAPTNEAVSPESLADLRREIHARVGLSLSDFVVLERGALPLTTSGKLCRAPVRRAYEAGDRLPGERLRRRDMVGAVDPA